MHNTTFSLFLEFCLKLTNYKQIYQYPLEMNKFENIVKSVYWKGRIYKIEIN